jgi:putative colanic acid biosynthesis acetyltransferase WcaF
MSEYQDLSLFEVPKGFRRRSAAFVQLWWLVQKLIFRNSPQVAYGFRRWLLRLFGASVGVGVKIRPTAQITYPWNVSIGDQSWIGDDAVLYSLGRIEIGAHAVISQHSYLCAGDHDYKDVAFPIRARPIVVEDQTWVATGVFVGPGVTIGRGCVVGARSAVFSDLPEAMICVGTPCKPVRPRERAGPAG